MESKHEFDPLELGKILAEKDSDWFLVMLLNIVNQGTIEFGLTLNVGGSVISGTLISGKKYFSEFAKQFSNAIGTPEEASNEPSIEESFRKLGDIYDLPEGKQGEELKNQAPVTYIHLRDANVFFKDGTIPTGVGVFWRGKLSSVDGFSLGNLNK